MAVTNPKLQQPLLVRKRKHLSQTETACSSGLMCDLVIACLRVQPQMIKVSCLRFYFDKIVEILRAQDFSFIITSSGNVTYNVYLYFMSEGVCYVDDFLINYVTTKK